MLAGPICVDVRSFAAARSCYRLAPRRSAPFPPCRRVLSIGSAYGGRDGSTSHPIPHGGSRLDSWERGPDRVGCICAWRRVSPLAACRLCGSTIPMDDTAAPTEQAPARPVRARRGGASNRQVVGDYVGQRAAEAAQAVRCAGLKPGLDRFFGCEQALIGQVVEQDPQSGSELARNGLVTLFVAAPASAQVTGEAAVDPPSPADSEPATARGAGVRRRRKSRRSGGARPAVPAAPPARLHEQAGDSPTEMLSGTEVRQAEPTSDAPSVGDGEWADASEEHEFVVQADDVFAGRASGAAPRWRRVYPRPANTSFRRRLADHPWLLRTTAAMLGLWLIVGVASALTDHHGRRDESPHAASRVQAAHTITTRPLTAHVTETSSTTRPARAARPRLREPVHRTRANRRAAQTARVAAPEPDSTPSRTVPAAVRDPAAPARAQSDGGLFSP